MGYRESVRVFRGQSDPNGTFGASNKSGAGLIARRPRTNTPATICKRDWGVYLATQPFCTSAQFTKPNAGAQSPGRTRRNQYPQRAPGWRGSRRWQRVDPYTIGVAQPRCQLRYRSSAYKILARALEEPMRVIARNAGYEPEVILENRQSSPRGAGIDARTGQIVDMQCSGILDPLSVVQKAIEVAVSGAVMALTTDVFFTIDNRGKAWSLIAHCTSLPITYNPRP